MRLKAIIFLAAFALFFLPYHSVPRVGAVSETGNAAYLFVEIETTVHVKGVETSSDDPEERRWYISSVIAQPTDFPSYSLIKKKFMPYFSRNVMDPAEARGILIDYGEQDVRVNSETSYANYETRAEAEEARNEAIEYRKGQGGNIYSFEIDFNNPKGESTSRPMLISRDKGQPNYEKARAAAKP
jgi:hypothetical protein